MNSLDLPGRARRHPRRRRDVGRRRFLGRRRPPEARGLRRRRRDAAALRPWRGNAPHRLVLRRPGHRRRAPRRRDARHSALRARLRGALPQGGDRPVRRELCRRRDADPLRFLQPDRQVRRPAGRPRANSAPMRWRPAITSAAAPTARTGRFTGPVDADRDQSYFLFATTQEQIDYLRFPLGGMSKPAVRAVAERDGADASPTRPTARTSASCRRASIPTSSPS